MQKEELIKKINKFLNESPFDDAETKMWQEKMPKMNEGQLQELFDLLQEKLKIITDTNQVFINIAEEIVEEQEKGQGAIPRAIVSIVDMRIDDLAEIFRKKLVKLLKNEKFNLFRQLDEYFRNSKLLKEKVVGEFDLLIKALNSNEEILINTSVSQWLNYYNRFNNSRQRKNIDRINFINKDERANKTNSEEKKVLLKLLKLYDFLLNPEGVAIGFKEKGIKKAHTVGTPKTEEEKNLDELRGMLERYPVGSLERKVVEEEIEKLESKKL